MSNISKQSDYKVFRDGRIKNVKQDNFLKACDKSRFVYICGQSESIPALVWDEFIGNRKRGHSIYKIDVFNRRYSVDNMIEIKHDSGAKKIVRFFAPIIRRVNAVRNNFNYETQLYKKLPEECRELMQAIESRDPKKIVDEIADVFFVSLQVALYLGISQVIDRFLFKLKRTEQRIKSGYYLK